MIDIPYTSPFLHYAGRWADYADSKGSAWQGAQVRFKVSGTTTFVVKAKVLDNSSSDLAMAVANVDDGPTDLKFFSTAGGTLTGDGTVSYTLPDTGDHTVVLKLAGLPGSQWSNSSYCRLKSISIDDGATLSDWGDQAPVKLGVVGDSWMGVENDWPYLLGSWRYSLYPTSYGGATASGLDSQYNYDRSGVLNTTDPELDAVLISSGVNDYVGGVSVGAFQTSLVSLVGKVRAKHPDAKIILLQPPRNVAAGLNYDQYGTAMAAVVAATSNSYYIPIPSGDWPLFEWASDTYHLTYTGRQAMADYVGQRLDELLPPSAQIELETEIGRVVMPLFPAGMSDALNAPVMDSASGLMRLRLLDVYPPLPDSVVLTTIGGRYFKVSS